MQRQLQSLQGVMIKVGSWLGGGIERASAWGGAAMTRFQVSPDQVRAEMDRNAKSQNTVDDVKKQADLSEQIKKLKMSTYVYGKHRLETEVADYRLAGASEVQVREFQSERERQLLEQRYGFSRFTDFMDKQFSTTISSMKGTMSNFVYDAFTGNLQSAKEYFSEFGKSILRSFSDIISEMIARWLILNAITGGLFGGVKDGGKAITTVAGPTQDLGTINIFGGGRSGGKGATGRWHTGEMIRAHSGLAIDEVPIIAQTGEGILSRQGMAALGGAPNLNRLNKGQAPGGVTINNSPVLVIQAWDSGDVMRKKKDIEALMVASLATNSDLRQAIMRYT